MFLTVLAFLSASSKYCFPFLAPVQPHMLSLLSTGPFLLGTLCPILRGNLYLGFTSPSIYTANSRYYLLKGNLFCEAYPNTHFFWSCILSSQYPLPCFLRLPPWRSNLSPLYFTFSVCDLSSPNWNVSSVDRNLYFAYLHATPKRFQQWLADSEAYTY